MHKLLKNYILWSVLGLCRAFGVSEVETAPVAIAAAATPPDFVLVGDSTVTEKSGWGQGFVQSLRPGVTCVNAAQGGRSSKSYRDEGFWAKALAVQGKVYLIQFGHNDQPGKGPKRETDPSTTFRDNMARYVAEARAQGAQVVLVTSLTRRIFDPEHPSRIQSTLTPWAEGTIAVGRALNVPVLDLHTASIALCEQLGPAGTAAFNFPDAKGKNDTTHLQAPGSLVFARLVIRDLVQALPALRDSFQPEALAP